MEAFEIAISDEALDDLRQRLRSTRWPDEMPGSGWEYGSNLDYVKELVEYWANDFDWREQERKLNGFQHYKSDVDGLSIHFILEKGTGPNPMPLVITHGWPSSIFEMTKLIPLLSDPGWPWRRSCRRFRRSCALTARFWFLASLPRNRECRCRRWQTFGRS